MTAKKLAVRTTGGGHFHKVARGFFHRAPLRGKCLTSLIYDASIFNGVVGSIEN